MQAASDQKLEEPSATNVDNRPGKWTLFNIVLGCASTIVISTWRSIHLNIPPQQSYLRRIFRKLDLLVCTIIGGLYHAPQIPAGIRSFQRIPVESGGIKNGRGASQYCHSRECIFQWNTGIPELRPECSLELTGMECDRNAITGIELST